jgi:hypothetical protein
MRKQITKRFSLVDSQLPTTKSRMLAATRGGMVRWHIIEIPCRAQSPIREGRNPHSQHHAITAYIISEGTTPSHSAPAPPSPRLVSPRFLFSSTRKIPPSEKRLRESHALLSDGVHAFSSKRDSPSRNILRHGRDVLRCIRIEPAPRKNRQSVSSIEFVPPRKGFSAADEDAIVAAFCIRPFAFQSHLNCKVNIYLPALW